MAEEHAPALLDLIHEAALTPARWNDVLRRLASMTGCVAGGLTVERPATRQGTPLTYFGFDSGHVERAFDYYLPMNPLFQIAPRMQRGFLVANEDVVPLNEFRRSDFYNGWARPQGLCSPITLVIRRTADSYVPLTLVRPDGAGGVTAAGRAMLTRLAPHLVHAMAITARLQDANEGGRATGATLAALPCAALLIDATRRVVAANPAADSLMNRRTDGPLRCTGGRIGLNAGPADRSFQLALSVALGLGTVAKAGQVSVPQPGGHGPLTASLTPLPWSPGEADGAWSALSDAGTGRARCLVLISGMDVAGLAERYGLTPAEARVMGAVLLGKGLAAAARELGIARSTAQSHLDKIFQKTGTNRQAELVGLAKAGFGS